MKLKFIMDKDEIEKLLNSLADGLFEGDVITKWFDEKYCKNCPTTEVILHNGKVDYWKECEFESKCHHQDFDKSVIRLWLDGEE